MPQPNRIFAAFAGGGAKGLIHIGVLKALEDREVSFSGLAGTSAGAIIAALKAAGFSSREILDADTGTTIMDQLKEIDPNISKCTDIFGRSGWKKVKLFRMTLAYPRTILFGFLIVVALIVAGLLVAGSSRSWFLLALAGVIMIGMIKAAAWAARSVLSGLSDVMAFRTALAELLRRKMFPEEVDRVVKMGDFGRNGRPTLKIVSANLSTRRLHLFSPDRSPDVPVADAVAASICLPLIFSPWRIGQSSFIDGGIVSNLPAWPFDEERELDPEAITIAIEIADAHVHAELGSHDWLPAAIRTALFGSGELNLRVSGQAERLVLDSRLDLLEFDLSLEQARQEVRDATAAASVRLDKRLYRRPEVYMDACELSRALAQDVLESALQIDAKRVRVAIAVPDRSYHASLRLRFSAGYGSDIDEGMLYPVQGSVLGAAWASGESRFELAPFPPELDLPGAANGFRRRLRWPGLAWQLCVPISDSGGHPRYVVQITGDAKLPASPRLEVAVTEIERSVKEFFDLIMVELSDLEDGHGVEERYL